MNLKSRKKLISWMMVVCMIASMISTAMPSTVYANTGPPGKDSPMTAALNGEGDPVNAPPVITEGDTAAVSMSEDGSPNPFSLTLNASDADDDALTWSIKTPAGKGTAGAGGTGNNSTITYTPQANYSGADSFEVEVSDGKGGTDSITVNVDISAVNDAPVITEGDTVTVTMDKDGNPIPFNLTLNGTDTEGDTLTWSIKTQGDRGTASVEGTGASKVIGYTPEAGYHGADSFVVQVSDGNGGADTIAVNVNVGTPNTAPVITEGDTVTVTMDKDGNPTPFNLTLNGTDAEGDTLTWSIKTPAGRGTASAEGTGASKVIGYTPEAGYHGTDSFVVQVSDGNGGADTVTVNVNVGAPNTIPVIAEGDTDTVNMDEDGNPNPFSLTLNASDTDGDTLTWSIKTGASKGTANVSGTGTSKAISYTPEANYNGNDSFVVQVSDGNGGIDTITINVDINAVADPPAITAGDTVTVNMDEDGSPTAFSLTLNAECGDSDTLTWSIKTQAAKGTADISGTGTSKAVSYTPQSNCNGADSFVVQVTDANGKTDTILVNVNIGAVNDIPSFTKGANQTVNEDAGLQTVTGWATNILKGDSNEGTQGLSFEISTDNDGLFSVKPAIDPATGNLTYTPKADASGTATITVCLKDDGGTANGGVDTSPAQTFTITINSVNDAPSFTKGANQAINEDAGPQTAAGWAADISKGAADETAQVLTFDVTTNNDGLFSVKPSIDPATGNLTYTPNANANGVATVTVILRDDGGTANGGKAAAAAQTFTITINSVNDAPSFTKGADQTINEDAGAQTAAGWATNMQKGTANESAQTLSFEITTDNDGLFSAAPAIDPTTGNLTYTPKANANGTATVTVCLKDSGGTDNGGVDTSAAQTFTITITDINDIPSFTKGADQTVSEDAGAQTIAGWATNISKGADNESAQNLSFVITTNNDGFFSSLPAIDAEGNLTYTLAENANGNVTITVYLKDDGGTANGGKDTSAAQTFIIRVAPVNDGPTMTAVGNQTINEDASAVSLDFTVKDVDNTVALLSITASSDNESVIPNTNLVIEGTGENRKLTFYPAQNQFGEANVTLSVSDGNETVTQTFKITVISVNDIPTITNIANQTINEDNSTGVIGFTVGDIETSADSLNVTAESNNTGLFPNGNISLTAVGADRTINLTPAANLSGTAEITVTVTDGNGGSKAVKFTVTVLSVNDAPTLNVPTSQHINEDTATDELSITVGDVETASGSLTVTAISSNQSLIPDANIVLGGSDANRTIKLTPLADENGSALIIVTVRDEAGTATLKTFRVTVSPINDKPTIAPPGEQTIDEDSESQVIDFTVGDIDNNAEELKVTATSSQTGIIPDENIVLGGSGTARTLRVTPLEDQYGATVITLTVSDGALTDTISFTINVSNVNDEPEIGGIGNQEIGENSATANIPFKVWDIDNAATDLTVTAVSDNTALVPNSGTNIIFGGSGENRTIKIVPAADQTGIATITVTVQDPGGLTDIETFNINVVPTGGSGVMSHILDQEIYEDMESGLIYFAVSAAYANDITITSSNQTIVPNANLVLATVGGDVTKRTLNIIPAPNQNGNLDITVTVSNGTDTAVQTFHVYVIPVNDDPVITGNPFIEVDEDNTIPQNDSIVVSDVDTDDTLVINCVSSNQVLIPNGNISLIKTDGNVTLGVTPVADRNGIAVLTVSAFDGEVTVTKHFTINVRAVNDLPTISAIENKEIDEDNSTGAISFIVGDVETAAGSLIVTATSSNQSIVPDSSISIGGSGKNRTITLTPAANQNGTVTITVSITDGEGTKTETFDVKINPVNDAPNIGYIANQVIEEDGKTPTLSFSIGDIDNTLGELTIWASSNNTALIPSNAVNVKLGGTGAARTILITPTANGYGTAEISIMVSDGLLTTTRKFTVNVLSVNDAPTISNIDTVEIDEDTVSGEIAFTVDDIETAAASLTVTVTSGNQTLIPDTSIAMTDNGASKKIVLTPALNQNGNTIITIKASDGETTTIKNFTLKVRSINDKPTISDISDKTILEDTAAGTSVSFTVGDVETAVGSIKVTATSSNTALVPNSSVMPGGSGSSRTLKLIALPDQYGETEITVNIYDGIDTTTETFKLIVLPVNDIPSFTKGANQTVNEDAGPQSVTGWATNMQKGPSNESSQILSFMVSNDNNALFSVQPAIDADGKLTYTPAPNASGTSTVTVYLMDDGGTENGGQDRTANQTFTITVNAVNDMPTFTKGADQTVLEDCGAQSVTGWATNMYTGAPDESQTMSFTVTNSNNAMFSVQPAIDASGKLTYTPSVNANGVVTVTVILKDNGGIANGGKDASVSQTFTITITPVNDIPYFTKGVNKTVLEDAAAQSVTGWATGISKGATNEASQTLTFVVTNNNNELFSVQPAIDASGKLTYTPAANANGVATVTVYLTDNGGTDNGGKDTSASQTFTITVTAVNDMPTFTKGADETVLEDCGAQSVIGWATNMYTGAPNESQTMSFTVTNSNNALFSVQPTIDENGKLTYTPAPNANGAATVTVVLKDNGGTLNGGKDASVSQTFTITITPVNDVPTFTKGTDVTVLEDAGAQSMTGWATGISTGAANEVQTLSFNVSNDNNALFSVQPSIDAGGKLTFTPAADANGTATVTVYLKDNGGTADGGADTTAIQTFVINVTAVNDRPTFTKGADEAVSESAGAQTVTGWATGISTGAANENQTLTFAVTNNNNDLFSVQPSIDADGNLTYTPAPNANGTATVTVYLKDNGGTANGGNDTSIMQTFTIAVAAVNNMPTFTKGADETVMEDAGTQSVEAWATNISAGAANELQVLNFTVTNDNNALFSVQPSIDTTGKLTYTPAPNASGTATVTVVLKDDGGAANGGKDTSITQIFTITVTPVNDIPSFTKGADETVSEDCGAQSVTAWAKAISTGAANELQSLSFTVTNDNHELFGVQPTIDENGKLTYTPAADASGTAVVTVVLKDNGGTANGGKDTSTTETFTITVAAVNDQPTFTKGANQTVQEDGGAQTVAGWAADISTGAANEPQSLTFIVTNDNNGLFSVQPAIDATGKLTYTLAPDANGTAIVTVVLKDDGGTANGGKDTSTTETFTITVTAVNDMPSFIKGADQTILEDAGAQTIAGWASGISTGASNEAQTLSFVVTNDNNSLFSVQPTIDENGKLTYTPAPNANGTAVVTVILTDDGGSLNGGKNSTVGETFTIAITPINDMPTFTKGADVTVSEDAGAQTVTGWAKDMSTGAINEDQTLTFAVTNNNNELFSVQPTIDASGKLTFTPASDVSGTATVTISLKDDGGTANGGKDTSASETFTITVNPVNDIPSFTKGADVSVLEDAGVQTAAGWATDIYTGAPNEPQSLSFDVTNSNNDLFSVQPTIDAAGALSYTPAPDANGTATVTVVLRDNGGTGNGGKDTSITQTFVINITAVNDQPTFTKGADAAVSEDAGPQTVTDWATGISTGAANENQTLTFAVTNDNNDLFSVQPSIDADGNLTYTPAPNANGTATVTVYLKDNGGTANGGKDTSIMQTFIIAVAAVNNMPTFTKGADETVMEDAGAQSVEAWATNISAGAVNELQVLNFTVTNDNNALFDVQPSIDATGKLTYTPAPNASGTATVTVVLKDDGGAANGGKDTSITQTFTITVTPVNDIPSFTKGADETVSEDCGAQSVTAWAKAISTGAANELQSLSFTVTNDNHELFSVQPTIDENGKLTYTPAADAYGTAAVTVVLKDNGGTANGGKDTSTTETFTITVAAVNDQPTFTKGANQTVQEDGGAQTVADWAADISTGAANEPQKLTFIVTNDNNSLFSVQPAIDATGKLTYTLAPDASGTAIVTVVLKDDGGTANGGKDTSDVVTFTITATAVNDMPSFIKGADQTILEDSGAQTIAGWASGISTGASNEAQTLSFVVTNDNNSLFSVQPTIDENGKLTYTPAPNANGTAVVTVTLTDDGGSSNGGHNSSASETFIITITPVNDMPTFTKGADVTVPEDAGTQTVTGWAKDISTGAANETQAMSFTVTNDNNALFAVQPTIDAKGNLSYTTSPNASGTATVTIYLKDDGGTANGGKDTSAVQTFTIVIAPVNDPPKADNDSRILKSGATVTGTVTASDPEKDVLTYTLKTLPADINGSFTINSATGEWTYASKRGYAGIQTIEVLVSDGKGGETTATLTFDVRPLPIAKEYTLTTLKNTKVGSTIEKIKPDSTNTSFSMEAAPLHGTVKLEQDGKWIYTPDKDFIGNDQFTVYMSDEKGNEALAIVHIVVIDKNLTLTGTVYDRETGKAINGAEVRLLDLSGKLIKKVMTDSSGKYSMDKLVENQYIIEVKHPSYSDNRRASYISYANPHIVLNTITEDFAMTKFTLELTAMPSSIIGDGISTTTLTAVIKDRNGNPISGVTVTFDAEAGTFTEGKQAITDKDGIARVPYKSFKLEGTDRKIIPVTATVADESKGLFASQCILVTFEPGFINGIVVSNITGLPVKGAVVKVYKDFDNDGITDFSFTQITGEDGKYAIAIPKGGIEYNILITMPVTVGDTTKMVEFSQTAVAGAITGAGKEVFDSNKTASGIILMKETDGSEAMLTDCSKLKLEVRDANGNIQQGLSEALNLSTGVFRAENLEKEKEYSFVIKYSLAAGKEIVVGKVKVKLAANGEINISRVLIDPYGTITDKATGELISGAKVELHYADTAKNKAQGITPGALVNLPGLNNFPPADNANPQNSDVNGKYAFMVFPDTDYYITATKDGYQSYQSPVISVGVDLVLHNFVMEKVIPSIPPIPPIPGGVIIPPVTPTPETDEERDLAITITADKIKVGENSEVVLTIKYLNRSKGDVKDVVITATIPEGMEITDQGTGIISGSTIHWNKLSLKPGITETLVFKLKAGSMTISESLKLITAKIESSQKLSNLEDDSSKLQILTYANRYGNAHKRYIKGFPDGEFKPEKNISRAEVAAIFARLLNLQSTVNHKGVAYKDVTDSYWARDYIEAVTKAGLMNGVGNGSFAPDREITRAELATIIARYFGVIGKAGTVPIELHFSDIKDNWARNSIEEIYRYHIVEGYNDGSFRPDNAITRIEAITCIDRMLYRGPIANAESTFPDVSSKYWAIGHVEESARTHEFTINEDGTETVVKYIDEPLW